MPPGTMTYVGNKESSELIIEVYNYTPEGVTHKDCTTVEDAVAVFGNRGCYLGESQWPVSCKSYWGVGKISRDAPLTVGGCS